MPKSNLDILAMDDEEFFKSPPPGSDEVEEPTEEEETETPAEAGQEDTQDTDSDEAVEVSADDEEVSEDPPAEAEPSAPVEEPTPEPPAQETIVEEPVDGPDYEAFYKRVMAPFKANGKTIELTSVDEVISLMQMGANYTKKMQSLKPYNKHIAMLEANGMLDEDKLSFYIDLDKKNPEAIKKFLKDAGIDPMDLDPSEEVNYKAGTHKVSDQHVAVDTVIRELRGSDTGLKTLEYVNNWDQQSKQAIWQNPEILNVIHSQIENGIYDKITAEIEKRQLVGQITPNTPFLHAYKIVGDSLFLAPQQPAASTQQPVTRTPVATTRKTPATKAAEVTKARAAAAPRSSSTPSAKVFESPLAMSDEEFEKLAIKVS